MSNSTNSALSLLNLTMVFTNITAAMSRTESNQKTSYNANDVLQILFGICIVGIIMGGGLCITYLRSSHLNRGIFLRDPSNDTNYDQLPDGPQASNAQRSVTSHHR